LNDDLVNKHSYLMHLISDFDYKSWLAGNGCIISETTKLYESQFIWDCVHYPYWLYLMSSMIEKGDKKSAEEILVKYIEKHHHKDIENYPLVSSLCVDLAITNENIRKSSFVLKSLYNNRSLLKEICSNKRIALVGNGPSEIDTRNGEIIDKFDIVIRFNNFMTDGFEKDYGKKTDIWVRNSAGNDIRNKIDIGEYSAVIWEADYHHFPFHYDDLHTINSQLTLHPDKISNFDSITHQLLSKKYQITQPTTGLITLFYLVTFVRPVKIGLFGFTFKEQEPQYVNNHYFDNRSLDDAAQRLSGHDMVLESKIINAIISESDIIELFL
ncbi:glycosyltransferase family 29 protein, partial [Rosenbergiella nectarea]